MIRVLVAEDHPDNREMLARRLARRGYEVLTAEDGQHAIEIATQEAPDVILMDVSMPRMSGLEATRYLRSQTGGAELKIIALTAHAMDHTREEAAAAGCDAFATKPIDFPELLGLIERLAVLPKRA